MLKFAVYDEEDGLRCPKCSSYDLSKDELPGPVKCNDCGMEFHIFFLANWEAPDSL